MRDITNKKIAVLCDTKDKIQKMLDVCNCYSCVTSETRYRQYKEDTCQNLKYGVVYFGSKIFYESEGYEIITFDEFMEENLTTYQMVALADVNGKTY